MRITTSSLLLLLGLNSLMAQNSIRKDTLKLSRAQSENLFLEKNLSLISERLNIDQAATKIIQSKLWPNPTLSVDQVNLWSTSSQQGTLPPLYRGFGTKSQISVELEQLVTTAGKRKKMIDLDKVSLEISQQYFEDFLRNLKLEFRNNLTQLQHTQAEQSIYAKQLNAFQNLLKNYQKQVDNGVISRSEFIRLKASELAFLKEINDLQKTNNELQKELKILMGLSPALTLYITPEGFTPDMQKIEATNIDSLIQLALENRPDLKMTHLEETYASKMHQYEKAQRVPDLTFKAGYDRGGNIMNDFVGLGLSFDIPFFDRNQGNIKSAKIGIEKSKIATEQKNNETQSEVIQVYNDLWTTKSLLRNIASTYEDELDSLLDNHLKNFTQRNLSMIEYLDFVDAYLENKKIILDATKELNEHFEQLKWVIGKEI
ncbi:TolC family protein [Flavobacterium sp. ZT3R18]|uniref:TolC family protein n=1 Tax=Flavobacterium sp. ZT3R18 TaxID=2594429 RepID=UPI00117BBDBB|nr:TolC family protein [Flavobacterium sp. ZT3R18]TRX35177.1 TolC family protein [Flavobacterium sp. ZT3R18]